MLRSGKCSGRRTGVDAERRAGASRPPLSYLRRPSLPSPVSAESVVGAPRRTVTAGAPGCTLRALGVI
ncbi:peptidase S15 [Edwardsiella piscicida]|nr:peptidase S15 [Edwardsiella piscicida]